jgi:hypothetical protein
MQAEKDMHDKEAVKEVRQLDSIALKQSHSLSLNLYISRFLTSVRNSKREPKSKRWSNQERCWLFLS